MSTPHYDLNRTVAAPDPAVETADQDLDPAISPAPNDQPSRQSARDKQAAIDASLNEGVFVTIQRVGSINGRTHTGVLVEAEAAEGESGAKYAVRTGQPGRPVVLSVSEMETVTVSSPPPPTASQD